MKLTAEETNFLKTKIQEYFPSDEILLFGSYAQGNARINSDVDICIKSKGPLKASQWQLLIDDFEESNFPKKIDIIDFHRVSEDFQKIITKTSVPL